MPRGLSPVGLHSRVQAPSYSAIALDSFNPWPIDSHAKRPCLYADRPLLPDVVELPLEPCAKRQRLVADRQQPLLHLPMAREKPHARFQQEANCAEVKRRRLDSWMGEQATEEEQAETGVKIEELEDEGHELALMPTQASSHTRRTLGCFGMQSQSPVSILNCIRDAFGSPSPEPSLRFFDNEDGMNLPNLIICKNGVQNAKQVCLWPLPMPSAPLCLEEEPEESSLPGLIIFDQNIRKPFAWPRTDSTSCMFIEEVEEAHTEGCDYGGEMDVSDCPVTDSCGDCCR